MSLTPAELEVMQRLRACQGEMENVLAALVDLNSHTANKDGVHAVGRIVEEHLETSGLRVGVFVSGVGGQHLIARTGHHDSHKLMLLGHLDTVYPSTGESRSCREDPSDSSRLLGPGVADMKGGLVVLLFAVRALAESGFWKSRTLTVFLSADEETGSPTARDLIISEAADHHLCLVLECGMPARESGKTTIVTERKGMGGFAIEIEGRESHAGAAKADGVSAALDMAKKIVALEALNDPAAGRSVNVGLAHSGTAVNTVPGRARMEVDYRFTSSEDGDELRAEIEEIANRSDVCGGGGVATKIRCSPGPYCLPLERTAAVGRMAERIIRWGEDLGLGLMEESRGGTSDGNYAAAACPVVDGLGAVGGRIHSDEEWVVRQSLVDRSCLLALTMMRFYELPVS